MAALGMPVLTTQTNLEQSVLNLDKKFYRMETCNDTYLQWMKVRETLTYSALTSADHPEEQTKLDQSTTCDMYASNYNRFLQWAVHLGEKAVITEVKSNIPKGRSAMSVVISKLITEFENFSEITNEKLQENTELAKIMIEKFGQEAIDNCDKVSEEIQHIFKELEQSNANIKLHQIQEDLKGKLDAEGETAKKNAKELLDGFAEKCGWPRK